MIVAILNPKSGGGKGGEAWSRVRQFLPGDVETFITRGPRHAIELTRTAINIGAKTVVAVGGDGTVNEVVNGFFDDDQRISHDARLAIVPSGTGSDFIRTLKLPIDERK